MDSYQTSHMFGNEKPNSTPNVRMPRMPNLVYMYIEGVNVSHPRNDPKELNKEVKIIQEYWTVQALNN